MHLRKIITLNFYYLWIITLKHDKRGVTFYIIQRQR
jgi:hypothetical protein